MQLVHSETFCHFPITSCSCENRYQALPALPYCKRKKTGRGLGMRLCIDMILVLVVLIVVVLYPHFNTDTMLHSQFAGQQLGDIDLPVIMEELNTACVKWYDIGMMLRVKLNRLDAIKEQYSNPSDCLRETLKMWLKIYPPHPLWSNIVDALRSDTVGETKLAADLKQKYCSTQDTVIAATHHPVSVTAVAASQPHILVTTLPQFMAPLSQLPIFVPPYSMQAQPQPSHSPPWSASYYSSPPTSYPMSAQFLPPPPSRTVHTPILPTDSHVLPGPTLVPSSYSVPTSTTGSLPHPILPSPLPSFVSDSTLQDTPPTPHPPTVTLPPEHIGM